MKSLNAKARKLKRMTVDQVYCMIDYTRSYLKYVVAYVNI